MDPVESRPHRACRRSTSIDLRFEPLAERPSKVSLADLGRPCLPGPSFSATGSTRCPQLLGAAALKRLRDAIVRASDCDRPIVAALGGHVVKTGCGPYLIDWIDRGILDGLALNGSAAIHDLELAIAGKTSEDVGTRLMAGIVRLRPRDLGALRGGLRARGSGRSVWVRPWARSSSSTVGRASIARCWWPLAAPTCR